MKTYIENFRFNEDLQKQIDGKLLSKEKPYHTYELGVPGEVLLSAGVPDLPIQVTAKTLAEKSNPNYKNSHPFDLSEVKDLPKAIQDPIMIFESKTRNDSKVILTELKSKGVNFVVAIEIDGKSEYNKSIRINSIRSLYPKDQVKDIVAWIRSGLLKYVNKEKALTFVTQMQSQFPHTWTTNDKAFMYNIINNFEKTRV